MAEKLKSKWEGISKGLIFVQLYDCLLLGIYKDQANKIARIIKRGKKNAVVLYIVGSFLEVNPLFHRDYSQKLKKV